MVKKSIIFLFVVSCLFSCKSNVTDVSQPPEGYSSNTTLKMACATGSLELIEKDFPIP